MADPMTLTVLEDSNNKQLTTALYLIFKCLINAFSTQIVVKDT
jgi:hypothetical protein